MLKNMVPYLILKQAMLKGFKNSISTRLGNGLAFPLKNATANKRSSIIEFGRAPGDYDFRTERSDIMSDNKKLKYKDKNSLVVRPDSQLGDVLSVCAVCGEIGLSALKLFGTDNGELNGVAKYGRIKRNALKDIRYTTKNGDVLYEGKAFNMCGEGKLKTLRPISKAYSIFDALEGGRNICRYEGKARGSDAQHTRRVVALSEWCVFCRKAGVEFNPQLVPPVYNLGGEGINNRNGIGPKKAGAREVEKDLFYSTVNIKEMDTKGKQYGRGSRANGLLLRKGGKEMPYVCFNFLDNAHLLWGSSDEDFIFYSKMDFGAKNFGIKDVFGEKSKALCLAENYEKAHSIIFSPPYASNFKGGGKTSYNRNFSSLFSDVYVFPRNEKGVKQFSLFIKEGYIEKLIEYFLGVTQKDAVQQKSSIYDVDYFDKESQVASLLFFNGCVTKLQKCAEVKKSNFFDSASIQLDVYVFDFQKEYVEKVLKDAPYTNIKVFTFKEILGIVSDEQQKGVEK